MLLGARQTLLNSTSSMPDCIQSAYSVGYSSGNNASGGSGNYFRSLKRENNIPVTSIDRSFSLWAKRQRGTSSPGYLFIYGYGDEISTSQRYFCLMVGSSTGIDPGNNVVCDANGAYVMTCSNASSDNLWHHYCLVVDNTNKKIYIYVDGVLKGSTSNSTYQNLGGTLNTSMCILGARNTYNSSSSVTRNLNGNITRMCVWDGALTAAEVLNDYNRNEKCPINGQTAVVSRYYSMQTNNVNELIDHVSGYNMQPFGNVSITQDIPSWTN